MKICRFLLSLLLVILAFGEADAVKKEIRTVVFKADMHCKSCQAKVEKNIPFEKGVKDLKVDLKSKTITVSFREDRNSVARLRKAIEDLHIKVLAIDGKPCVGSRKEAPSCCGPSGE